MRYRACGVVNENCHNFCFMCIVNCFIFRINLKIDNKITCTGHKFITGCVVLHTYSKGEQTKSIVEINQSCRFCIVQTVLTAKQLFWLAIVDWSSFWKFEIMDFNQVKLNVIFSNPHQLFPNLAYEIKMKTIFFLIQVAHDSINFFASNSSNVN